MNELEKIIERLKSIKNLENKDERYLVDSYIDACEEMLSKEENPSFELVNDLNQVLDLFEV